MIKRRYKLDQWQWPSTPTQTLVDIWAECFRVRKPRQQSRANIQCKYIDQNHVIRACSSKFYIK